VKALAMQTAKASEEISRKITAIREDRKGALEPTGAIMSRRGRPVSLAGSLSVARVELSRSVVRFFR
jgi:hypothetical protein